MLDGAVADIVASHAVSTTRLRSEIDTWVQSYWEQMGSWRGDDIAAMAPAVTRRVEAAQHRMGALTDVYLTNVLNELSGERHTLAGVAPGQVSTQALRGVAGEDVYARPGATVWTALSDGAGIDTAQAEGLQRLRKLAATGLQLAKTHTARRALTAKPVAGYRRVLVGKTNCALCIVASTARYRRGDLQPIHPGCDCTVLPIWAGKDPGWVIDSDQLDQVHDTLQRELGAMSGSARQFATIEDEAISYRDVLVTHQHGEIGPVLGIQGRPWRSLADIQR